MILITHILIALSSVAFATYLLFKPSQSKLIASYSLIAATLASGVYLTVLHPAHLAQTCLSGLAYISIVSIATIFARRRITENNR